MSKTIKKSTYMLCSVTFIVLLCVLVNGELIGLGSCPTVTPGAGIPLNGTWYEQSRFDPFFHNHLQCVQYTFGVPVNNVSTVDISAVHKLTGRVFTLHGTTTQISNNNTYAIDFSSNYHFAQNFIVLGIVDGGWATLYSCKNHGFFNLQQAVVLTADRNPNATILAAARLSVQGSNLPLKLLKDVEQSFC